MLFLASFNIILSYGDMDKGYTMLCIKGSNMQITEQQLRMSVSQLSVKDLIGLMTAVLSGNISDEKFFNDEWIGGTSKLAKYLNCSKATISRRIKDGDFKGTFIKSGNTYWFDRKKIRKIIESGCNSKV